MIDNAYAVTLETKPDSWYPDVLYLTRSTYTDGTLALLALTDEDGYPEDWDTMSVNLSDWMLPDEHASIDWTHSTFVRATYKDIVAQLERAGALRVTGSLTYGLGPETALLVTLDDLDSVEKQDYWSSDDTYELLAYNG